MLAEFFRRRGRIFTVLLCSAVAMGIFGLATFFCTQVLTDWTGFLIGGGMMVAAIPCHWLGKKYSVGYLLSFLLNSMGCGCSASAYYLEKHLPVSPVELLLGILPAVGILILADLLLGWLKEKRRVALWIAAGVDLLCIAGSIVLWILDGRNSVSFGCFCLILALFYLCVLGIPDPQGIRSVLRDISFGSFGVFVAITLLVVVILSEGDAIDGLDLLADGHSQRKKKKQA